MKAPELIGESLVENYLRQEETAKVRHELIGGVIYEMSGGTPNHADLIYNVAATMAGRLRGTRCRGSSSEQRIRFEGTRNFSYSDGLIKCPPFRFDEQDPNSLLNPRAVFEVLSPSTADYDRTTKFELYQTIPEFTDYILLAADRVRVEHFRRLSDNAWELHVFVWRRETLNLVNFEIELPLEELYEGINVPEGIIIVEPPEDE